MPRGAGMHVSGLHTSRSAFRKASARLSKCFHFERGSSHTINVTGFLIPLIISMVAFVMPHGALAGEEKPSPGNNEVELESLRSRIKDIQSNIETARSDTETFIKEIEEAEQAAATASSMLQDLESAIQHKTGELRGLEQQRAERQAKLDAERELLAGQIRIAYQTGHNDFLKLLLNQEDPSTVSRMAAYHDYHGRARARRVNAVITSLNEIESLENSIENETAKLESLRTQQVARLDEFGAYRKSRKDSIAGLEAYIADQGKQLQLLQRNEKELALLLNKLEEEQVAIQLYEELTPFNELKGKLKWPVKGTLIGQFGAERKGGKLRWQGVKIAASQGEAVHAVSAGKVIFADWFRNLGLLMIVDHGGGYMSLYGNNESLLKKPGDTVKTGEVIAKVGDTGGEGRTGLYFEIRQEANPLNPGIWCRG